MKKVVIDIFGADCGPEEIVDGALKTLAERNDFCVVFAGDKALIEERMKSFPDVADRVEILDTNDFIRVSEPPMCTFSGRNESSMVKALLRLKEDEECVGMLSAGNTGALLVGSVFRLGMKKHPAIGKMGTPALASMIPLETGGWVCLTDCGANVDCKASDIVNYAILASDFLKEKLGIENPRVGLMSVGREDGKGNALSKEAFELMKQAPINFVGNIEGNDLLSGYVDVVATDGFTGNVLLKNVDAFYQRAARLFNAEMETADEAGKIALRKAKDKLDAQLNLNNRGGATFLGPSKIVIKMHGSATAMTVYYCIDQLLCYERGTMNNFKI